VTAVLFIFIALTYKERTEEPVEKAA
jgi:hypothetical protein